MKKFTVILIISLFFCYATTAQTLELSAFTFQGRLNNSGAPANGVYDMRFRLFDSPTAGVEQGTVQDVANVVAVNGDFTVLLDFGADAFNGFDRYLEISISLGGQNNYSTLSPRQKLTSAPFAVQSVKAKVSSDSDQLGGVAADQYVLTGDPRMSDPRPPLPGSTDYVQNTGTPQPGANFNVGGTGSAGILNAQIQFSIGGARILSNQGIRNLFAGVNAGAINTGTDNTFVGHGAGSNNSTGSDNSFFGTFSGNFNTTGSSNAFYGDSSGSSNTIGNENAFFGRGTGSFNTTGNRNAFFGRGAGALNSAGSDNTFAGMNTGFSNSSGQNNSFFGRSSGESNTTASLNSFFGAYSGFANTTGSNNAFFGGDTGRSNTTGFRNSFYGTGAGWANTSGSDNAFFGYQAGLGNTSAGYNAFFGADAGRANTAEGNSFFGSGAGISNVTGLGNSFFGRSAGFQNTGSSNTFIGSLTGANNTVGNNNVFIGSGAGNPNTSTQVSNSIAIGTGVTVSTNNTIVLGTTAQSTQVFGALRAGIFNGLASVPALDVVNSAAGGGVVVPNLYIRTFAQGSSGIHLCWKAATDGITANVITNCSSPFSEGTQKQNIEPFTHGLSIIKRLKPVAFKWKDNGSFDVGLNAEDVAEIAPDLVTLNDKGKVVEVKEHSLNILFINAFKQQQAQIEELAQQNKDLQRQLEALKKLIFSEKSLDAICRKEPK